MYDIIVIGGGPAGLAAAIQAKKQGVDKILVLERDQELGGILQQCIHNGFGLHIFKEELTGPEYAQKFIDEFHKMNIDYKLDTMVLDVTEDKDVHVMSTEGYQILKTKSIIMAMGCRERTRGAVNIPGKRPAGIYTAGTAQRLLNIEGYMVGKKVLILGSGDIGLIMARRMTLEGAKVEAVCELMPHSGGLTRNIVQCLEDFDIPLKLSHTVVDIIGHDRLEAVVIAKVDENLKPINGTEERIECDTLLLSIGLIPENELSKQAGIELDPRTKGPKVNHEMSTSQAGIFACGNVVHVHDLVDFVTDESRNAGYFAAKYIQEKTIKTKVIELNPGKGVVYTVPQYIDSDVESVKVLMRVNKVYRNHQLVLTSGDKTVKSIKKKHMAPGEMLFVNLSRLELEQMTQSLNIEVKEV